MAGVGEDSTSGASQSGKSKREAIDFMLKEYEQIATAFFALHTQKNQTLKYYLTLVTVGVSAIALVFRFLPQFLEAATGTPPILSSIAANLTIGLLATLLAALGFLLFNSFLGIRADMILYARVVNRIRAFFFDRNKEIEDYIELPIVSSEPPFREGAGTYFVWELLTISLLNSLLVVGGVSLAVTPWIMIDFLHPLYWWQASLIVSGLVFAHYWRYLRFAAGREVNYKEITEKS